MRIGIDLGGTKIAAIALDDNGETRAYERLDTPKDDYPAILATITSLVAQLEAKTGLRGSVGVCTPGAISPDRNMSTGGLLRNSNSVCLNGKPLDQDIAAALGRDIRMANDADCFALSEATDGAAAGAASVFGVILGTGVGGGLVINGQLLNGPNAIAGEWGHNPLPYAREDERPGLACYCGKQGCIETFLSGPGLEQWHVRRAGIDACDALSSRDIVAQAASGDQQAADSLQRYSDQLARALSVVINIFDPQVIVLGGGLSNIEMLYETVQQQWGEYVFSDVVNTRLANNAHGDDSGVRGAARLWPL